MMKKLNQTENGLRKNCGSPHEVRAQKRHTYFVRVSAIFANQFCLGITVLFLCLVFVLMPVIHGKIEAKNFSKLKLPDGTERQNKINDLLRAVEKIRQNKALPDDVRRDSLEDLLKELTSLLREEIGYLEGQRDAFVATETNETAKNAVKKSFDKNIQHWKDVLSDATLEKLLAGNNPISSPEPKDGNKEPKPTPTESPKPPEKETKAQIKIINVPQVGDEFVSAKVENFGALKNPKLQFFVSGTTEPVGSVPVTVESGTSSPSIFSNRIGTRLKSGQTVTYRLIAGEEGKEEKKVEITLNVFGKVDPTESGLFGMLFSGLVTTRQVQTSNEAAPFLGFQVGWGTKVKGVLKELPNTKKSVDASNWLSFSGKCDDVKNETNWEIGFNTLKAKGRVFERVEDDDFNVNNNRYRTTGTEDVCEISFKRGFAPFTGWNTSRWSFRFQGLFSNEARTATATPTESPLPAGQLGTPFRFLQHRQSFSPEFTAWREWNPLGQFSYGFYGTIGATTALDSNEGNDQLIVDPRNNRRVKANVISGGGLKIFGEVGSIQHLKFNPGRFLLQNFVGFGYYEAFRGSTFKFGTETPNSNSRYRLINKLRIFPEGINVDFGRQITVTPMFGYDINAGFRGPSNIRFFTGFAIKLRSFDGTKVEEK